MQRFIVPRLFMKLIRRSLVTLPPEIMEYTSPYIQEDELTKYEILHSQLYIEPIKSNHDVVHFTNPDLKCEKSLEHD
jgi:hypothetical protein